MLTQNLRALEADGLVDRRVYPTVPVTVEYRLTPLGQSLHAALCPLKLWAETHMGEVLRERSAKAAGKA